MLFYNFRNNIAQVLTSYDDSVELFGIFGYFVNPVTKWIVPSWNDSLVRYLSDHGDDRTAKASDEAGDIDQFHARRDTGEDPNRG